MTRYEIPTSLLRPDELRLGRENGELLPVLEEWCSENISGGMTITIERHTHGTGVVGTFSIAAYAEFEDEVDAVAFKMVWL